MAFKLFFAGWGSKFADEYLRSKNANRLLSWVNESRCITMWEEANMASNLFIDSGAYTVAHSDLKIDVDDYLAYIDKHPKIGTWAELDVIPYPQLDQVTAKKCSEGSWNNYIHMKEHNPNATILPIYHYGEPESGLERILNTEINGKKAEYIGVGGRHGVSTDDQLAYFHDIWCIIKRSSNPNVKVHAFGVTIPRILERFPFYSADSSTWVQAGINGHILLEDLTLVTVSNGSAYKKTNVQSMPDDAAKTVAACVEKFGYNYDVLCNDYHERLKYNIDVMLAWEKNYQYTGPKDFISARLF